MQPDRPVVVPRQPPAAPPRLLKVIGAVLAGALVAQMVLGWGLGVPEAWMAVLLVAAIVAVLAVVDAARADAGDDPAADEAYDGWAIAVLALATGGAVACVYVLPLPWGGVAAGVIVAAVVGLGLAAR